jgi:cytochrome c
MDSFELNKIAGAVLAALLLIFGGKTLIELNQASHGEGEIVGYALPAPAEGEGEQAAAGQPAAAAIDFTKIAADAASADAGEGAGTFKKCASCHSAEQGGPNKVGPDLWGVVGRPKASHAGFSYSAALKEKGGEWTLEDLAHFLHKPKDFVSGTKMVFPGISNETELTNLLAYLNSLK